MRPARIITIPLAAVLSAAAVAGPAAAAPLDAGKPSLPASPTVQPIAPVDARSVGFDWSSAGIGAAGGVGVLAIALAGSTGLRRRRGERAGSLVVH
jgi:hypothetical protein